MQTGSTQAVGAGLIVACLFLSTANAAHAGDELSRSTARDLGYEGVQAYQAGDYAVALDKLTQAQKMLPAPSLTLWKGRAQEKSGLWVEAAETYLQATRADVSTGGDQKVQQKAQKEAWEARAALLPRIPKLVVVIEGAQSEDVTLVVDGQKVPGTLAGRPLPTNPKEVVVVGALGAEESTGRVEVREGQSVTVTLTFEGTSETQSATTFAPHDGNPKQRRWQPLAGWIGIGTGTVAAGVGLATGLMGQSIYKDLDCDDDGVCPVGSDDGRVSTANTFRVVSPVLLITGGVLVAAGVTLLLTDSKPKGSQVAAYVGLTHAGLRGSF